MDRAILLEKLVDTAREAGRAILEIYGSDFGVSYKSDSSPLTEADRRSHEIISARLAEAAPEVPLLSEEGRRIPYQRRKDWRSFFLIDPLDGTKEFVNRNGEFTVNIALIEEGCPVMGVVHVPVEGTTYYAAKRLGAYRIREGGAPERIAVREASGEGLVVAASRSHASPGLDEFLGGLKVGERVSRGSSLKFCLVAEGGADVYPRLGPTWEWDTGAGHSVVEEAGGSVTDLEGNAVVYNKESLKHEGFVVIGDSRIRVMMDERSGRRRSG